MRKLAAVLILTSLLGVEWTSPSAHAAAPKTAPSVLQVVPDCGSGCNGPTDERFSITLDTCIPHANTSCGPGCTCWYGFLLGGGGDEKGAPRWFHIYFDRNGKATVKTPGPLTEQHVKADDPIYRINGRVPARSAFSRFTRSNPAKYAEARWDTNGRLHLRIWR